MSRDSPDEFKVAINIACALSCAVFGRSQPLATPGPEWTFDLLAGRELKNTRKSL